MAESVKTCRAVFDGKECGEKREWAQSGRHDYDAALCDHEPDLDCHPFVSSCAEAIAEAQEQAIQERVGAELERLAPLCTFPGCGQPRSEDTEEPVVDDGLCIHGWVPRICRACQDDDAPLRDEQTRKAMLAWAATADTLQLPATAFQGFMAGYDAALSASLAKPSGHGRTEPVLPLLTDEDIYKDCEIYGEPTRSARIRGMIRVRDNYEKHLRGDAPPPQRDPSEASRGEVTDAQAKVVCDALGVDDSYTDELQPLLEKWLNGESSTEYQLRTMLRVLIADMRAMLDEEPHFANIHTGRPVRATAIVSVIQNLSMALAGLDYRNCEASSAWHDRNAPMFEYAHRGAGPEGDSILLSSEQWAELVSEMDHLRAENASLAKPAREGGTNEPLLTDEQIDALFVGDARAKAMARAVALYVRDHYEKILQERGRV